MQKKFTYIDPLDRAEVTVTPQEYQDLSRERLIWLHNIRDYDKSLERHGAFADYTRAAIVAGAYAIVYTLMGLQAAAVIFIGIGLAENLVSLVTWAIRGDVRLSRLVLFCASAFVCASVIVGFVAVIRGGA